jgi:arsenite methyltransferase
MTASPVLATLAPEEIRGAVAARYGQVATDPTGSFNFPVGRDFALAVGYPPETVAGLPEGAVRSFAGVTYYHGRTGLRPGETVLDLGCGAGLDAILAARAVGTDGQVVAVDYAAEMVALAQANATAAGIGNLRVEQAAVEALPLPDAAVDVAQANGVFNLSPEKDRAVREVWRVLKPGGRLVAAEIVLHREVADRDRATLQDWFR